VPFGEWGALPPEVNSRMLFNGPGPGPMRQTADSFRQMGQTFETLALDVDSQLAQLRSTWRGDAADRGEQAFRQYSTGLRDMATTADSAAQQATAQAAANASARSSMPREAAIMAIKAAIAAALARFNFGLAAALMGIYMAMWSQAASTMSGYEGATMPNLPLPPPQQVPPITNPITNPIDNPINNPITNPGPGASDAAAKLADSFNGQPGQSFTPPEPMDTQPSSSSTLAELNDAESGSAGGRFGGIAGGIGLIPGGAAAMSSSATGFRVPAGWQTQPPPRAFGLPGGVPATAPMAGGAGPGMVGPGARTRRDRDKERERVLLDGTVVAPDHSDEVPEVAGLGVVDRVEPDEEVAVPGGVAVPDERPA
jgi:WXG100 family type VII secretion target